MTQPACMTDPEYALWAEANRTITSLGSRATTPCTDCPLAFAVAMRGEGCCDGTPGRRYRPRLEDTPRRAGWRASQQRRRDRMRT